MSSSRYCDGIRRRDVLRIGMLGATGLTLADYLRMAEGAQDAPASARGAIFINLTGGPSHIDSFDPKPDAPVEYRGEFKAIASAIPGIQLCEHLPQLAAVADKWALLRGVSHTIPEHQMGTKYLNTGNRPLPSLEFPATARSSVRSSAVRPICRRSWRYPRRHKLPESSGSSSRPSALKQFPVPTNHLPSAASRWIEV